MVAKNIIKGLIFATALLVSLGVSAENYKQQAQQWLATLDAQKYGESWEQADALFKSQVTKSDWQRKAKAARSPMGALVRREMKAAKAYSSLPGAPDGNYMVIQYNSSFTNKKSAVETLTLNKSRDQWRMVGYFIK